MLVFVFVLFDFPALDRDSFHSSVKTSAVVLSLGLQKKVQLAPHPTQQQNPAMGRSGAARTETACVPAQPPHGEARFGPARVKRAAESSQTEWPQGLSVCLLSTLTPPALSKCAPQVPPLPARDTEGPVRATGMRRTSEILIAL